MEKAMVAAVEIFCAATMTSSETLRDPELFMPRHPSDLVPESNTIFRHNLFVSANISQTRYLPQHTVAGDEYKYGVASAVNVFWNPTPRVQFGAEIDFGWRNNFNGERRYGKRAGALCMFTF